MEQGRKGNSPPPRWDALGVACEAVVVLLVGGALSLAANAVSPRGLKLNRDYFFTRAATNPPPMVALSNAPASSGDISNRVVSRLIVRGLHPIGHAEVEALFRDPRYAQSLVVFVDARDDRHFQEGHIPGAYQLDYYRPEGYLPEVLPVCQVAEQIVVYCNGGECEDSEFAARLLEQSGVPGNRVLLYPGGMLEWAGRGLPVEVGARGSGQFKEARK